ncbi:MAG: cell wall biosynthesis glycosyltransferase [Candidatus Gottesmanbacteria bacterium GW2011_GWA2_43_14]|uniref:Cell wall biosynthesis glycosyltransferase n=1 Tax=Candidatus Gottesmanbacteria bacterium GW2011_GWA2_43_14 TaxID=1618443 RepID=A0A0G1DJV9_9BACT|nr:MAG: cell wall biosynthesis glycosyltransferase [Candidatus Gottesmanbacteria bacterium GW2011_GWA2_43_14]
MKPISPLPLGISTSFWFIIGFIRAIHEQLVKLTNRKKTRNVFKKQDIAVIVPAHNEEKVIGKNLRALSRILDKRQIFVASDGSTDKTYEIAKKMKVHAVNLSPGRGKAKALTYLISCFRLFSRYRLIFIVDADTEIDRNYLKNALPFFNDAKTAVVFGSAHVHWPRHIIPKDRLQFVSYRIRLNLMLVYFMIYGQTWKYSNVSYVVPGFATLYRSDVLKQLEIDTPGLLIEDFNLAFQLHKKGLGRIAYHPSIVAWDQHPDNLTDYWNQVKRWNIGFFQTVRHHGFWPSFFYLSLIIFSLEVFLNSILMVALPFLLIYLILPSIWPNDLLIMDYQSLYLAFGPFKNLTLNDILVALFIWDYLMTVFLGIIHRKPQFIFYGVFFVFIHFITSVILLISVIPGFLSVSDGRWISPTRRKE